VGPKKIPDPSILDGCVLIGIRGGRKVWKTPDGKFYYTWDSLHGEVEKFNSRGYHLGAFAPETGLPVKGAVRGRKLNV
jgi:hypothetical protein